MSFDPDFDFSYDTIVKHIQDELSHLAQYLPPEVEIPSFDDISGDLASLGDLNDGANEIPQGAAPASFTLQSDHVFDFGKVQPHVVEQHGPDYSTKTETWNHDESHQTGAGAKGWSNSGSFADAFPKADTATPAAANFAAAKPASFRAA
ncbi:hypothetical protein [Methylobacterium persicinum]|uniref:Uncharacterized protein n=1 Tax=Methylobacterium persicinum TaxID=374426 RepID=A0ABU0HN95_9HYPH|nr:hypothetical protein [Methylobacterium persicinum]MDQ0443794.1 hypothetical protein [Methylobacterium persicinum]GJE37485.1 hypothetical protein KHHGKMAE_1544 [Methylobacterium persicinum]